MAPGRAPMRVTFDKIEARGVVKFTCAKCKKKRTRTRTFWMTANPFNRDSKGVPKSRDRVRADVNAEARAWEKTVTMCARCDGAI